MDTKPNVNNENTNNSLDIFYRKPQTQEELIRNFKEIKRMPSDTQPKVLIKLSESGNDKFIYVKDVEGREYVIALPIDKMPYHADLLNFIKRCINKTLQVQYISGGYIKSDPDNNRLILHSRSQAYGEAPKKYVASILRSTFPDIDIKIDSDLLIKYKCYLNKESDEFITKFCIDVLSKVINLGYNYIRALVRVNDNLSYMVHASENGSSFGFDTLYIGYKDKKNVTIIKDVLRTRWYLHIDNICIKNIQGKEVLYIEYHTQGKAYTLKIDLDEIEKFKTIDDFSYVDKQIYDMYKSNQFVFTNK